jgi:hypothetical protein
MVGSLNDLLKSWLNPWFEFPCLDKAEHGEGELKCRIRTAKELGVDSYIGLL